MDQRKSPEFWEAARSELAARDKVLGKIIHSYQGEMLVSKGDAFYTLARSIAGQQISVKAADSIWRRMEVGLGGMTPPLVLGAEVEALRGFGLSQQKVNYLKYIAGHFHVNAEAVAGWHGLEDEALIKELVSLKGVGRWTAEMMLIFHYLRADILPVDDLGLLKAISLHYTGGEKVSKALAREMGEAWRPYRSVATWYLWRALDPLPVEY